MICQIALTIIGTVISGVVVFILCQIIIQRFIKPYEDFKVLKGQVAYMLVMYANLYANPIKVTDGTPENYKEERRLARTETRRLAAEVSAFQERTGKLQPGVSSKERLQEAASNLIGLSNSYFLTQESNASEVGEWNRKRANDIRKALSIFIDPRDL